MSGRGRGAVPGSLLRGVLLPLLLVLSTLLGGSVAAAVLPSQPVLPSELALRAAREAVDQCAARGFGVTATVVNPEGGVQVVLRGDGATPHTVANSFNKAHAVVTLGPIFRLASTSELYEALRRSPYPIAPLPLPATPLDGLAITPGAVTIPSPAGLVGGLGVSGASSGSLDETCAREGVRRIAAELSLPAEPP